jgi:hypothetical protein
MALYGGCGAGLGAASARRIESEMDLARLQTYFSVCHLCVVMSTTWLK